MRLLISIVLSLGIAFFFALTAQAGGTVTNEKSAFASPAGLN